MIYKTYFIYDYGWNLTHVIEWMINVQILFATSECNMKCFINELWNQQHQWYIVTLFKLFWYGYEIRILPS